MTGSPDPRATAEAAARAGGTVAHDRFRTDLAVEEKGRGDLVTEADHAAQSAAVDAIRERSDAPIVAEEVGAADAIPDGPAWVIDPIDGTTNYSRGVPIWACSVAALDDGEPIAAATAMPALDDIVTAGPGGAAAPSGDTADRSGTTRNGEPVAVSGPIDAAGVAIAPTSWGAFDDREALADALHALAGRFGKPRRFGSMQTALASVAWGGLDAVVASLDPHPWDSIAGVHLVRRAGGRATDWEGERWRHDSPTLVASNGAVHADVLDAVAELG